MPNNETTTKFKVDISELKKAMQDAKRQISIANSEFKEVSSSMDDWSKSTDGISAKLKQLDSNLKSQKTILKSLEGQYEAVVAEQGEGSAAADRLKVAINNQKAAINKTEREISNYENTLEEVGEAEKIAAKTGKSVADVLEDIDDKAEKAGDGFTVFKGAVATFAGNAITSLVGGIKDAASNILNLADETREYRTELGKLDTAFSTAGHSTETATKTYKDLYAVLGDEGQSVEAANMLAKLCKSEEDLSKWTKIATGVYGTFGSSLPVESLAEAANETSKTGALTGGLADALNWAGVSEDKFQESLDKCSSEQERQKLITDTLNGLYSEAAKKYEETNGAVMDANRAQSDYTDTMATLGQKVEPITTKVREGFNQLLQKILELVGDVDMEAFTSKIEEGFKVLTDDVLPAVKDGLGWILDNKDSIIAGLAGIAAGFVAFKVVSLIQGVVGAIKAFKAANEGATVAQWLLNVAMNANPIGIIVALIAGLVAAFVVLWKKSDSFRNFWIGLWDKIKEGCAKAIEGIGKFFTETIPNFFKGVIEWVKKNWKTLLLIMINPFAGLFKYFYENNSKFKEFVDNAVKWIKELPKKIGKFLYDTLVTVTSTLIALPILAVRYGKQFVENMIQFFKELPSKVWTWLVNTVNKINTWRQNMIAKAKEVATNFVKTVVNFIKNLPSNVWNWLVNTASKVVSWGSNLASKGKEAAVKLFNAVTNGIKNLPSKIISIGKDLVSGLWNGITNKVSWLKNKIKGFVGDVTGFLKKYFKIGSPSKLMRDEIGRWLPEGMAVGIDRNAKSVLSSMRNLASDTLGVARDGLTTTGRVLGTTGGVSGGVTNNFYQTINSPKQLSRLDIYRQSKNLLGYAGGGH
jgi:phage-related protein